MPSHRGARVGVARRGTGHPRLTTYRWPRGRPGGGWRWGPRRREGRSAGKTRLASTGRCQSRRSPSPRLRRSKAPFAAPQPGTETANRHLLGPLPHACHYFSLSSRSNADLRSGVRPNWRPWAFGPVGEDDGRFGPIARTEGSHFLGTDSVEISVSGHDDRARWITLRQEVCDALECFRVLPGRI